MSGPFSRTRRGGVWDHSGLPQQTAPLSPLRAEGLSPLRPDQNDPDQARKVQQAIYQPALYGDMQITPVVFAAAGENLILPRPNNRRILLMIQNSILGGTIVFTFDQVASAVNGWQIGPGGAVLFDNVVPQNDLHIYSPIAGTAIVGWINLDVANATA